MIRKLLKFIRTLVIIYVAFGICVVAYSFLWLGPHAERALREFKSSATVGMKLETIQAIAQKAGADSFTIIDISPPKDDATKLVSIAFHRFAGGYAADVCHVYLRDNIAIKVVYSFRG
ncbi:hypothetical protein [Trichlorobacter lovleyi]|uniref:hypothetical protein n=1 Tax=Trichlorobacter lovleyi TaxID=313985 RepID=UPI003D144508